MSDMEPIEQILEEKGEPTTQEQRQDGFLAVARVEDIPPGKGRAVKVAGKTVALFQVDGRVFAINNICPHEGGPLAKGRLKGFVVSCPWHDLQFDIRSGYGTDGGGYCVVCYDVKVIDGYVYVKPRRTEF